MKTEIYNLFQMPLQTFDLPETESAFYQALARNLIHLPEGMYIVHTPFGDSKYEIRFRSHTKTIFSKDHAIRFEKSDTYPTVYLTCIDPSINAYKFYKMEQQHDQIIATYGRIGKNKGELFGEREYQYPLDMYWIKCIEKLEKGYQDKTTYFLDDDTNGMAQCKRESKDVQPNKNTAADQLFAELYKFAHRLVKSCINMRAVPSGKLTAGMAKEARRLLTLLYQTDSVESFNQILLQLLTVAPRNVLQVKSLLATNTSSFHDILEREENIVGAMESLLLGQKSEDKNMIRQGGFESLGILIEEASASEYAFVKEHLNNDLPSRVQKVYKVIHKKQQERFTAYCDKNHISKTLYLWHGSRNENWLSIMDKGLLLKPNAVITGKMFGNGIYFAPKSTKSWGYTSHKTACWNTESSYTAFMGLYETAYGEPLHVERSYHYTKKTLQGKNCVHAHAGTALKNDEIIFYDEAAMVLKYIVKFE